MNLYEWMLHSPREFSCSTPCTFRVVDRFVDTLVLLHIVTWIEKMERNKDDLLLHYLIWPIQLVAVILQSGHIRLLLDCANRGGIHAVPPFALCELEIHPTSLILSLFESQRLLHIHAEMA